MPIYHHIPNGLTATRGLCGPVVAILLIQHPESAAAFGLFLVCCLSDLIDGALARKLKAQSKIGSWLDPLADKCLITPTWLALCWAGDVPIWIVSPILLRDSIVLTVWAAMKLRGVSWTASPLGQVTMAFEMVAICMLSFRGSWLGIYWPSSGLFLSYIAVLLSVASLMDYGLKHNRK